MRTFHFQSKTKSYLLSHKYAHGNKISHIESIEFLSFREQTFISPLSLNPPVMMKPIVKILTKNNFFGENISEHFDVLPLQSFKRFATNPETTRQKWTQKVFPLGVSQTHNIGNNANIGIAGFTM